MDARIIALKLFLDELDIDPKVDTLEDRKRIQKAVYLGQLFGVDLGYRFSWYLMGPYSSGLTRDYFELAECLAMEDKDYEDKILKSNVKDLLCTKKELLTPPDDGPGSKANWLELLASYHYLRNVSTYDDEKTKEVFSQSKEHLVQYIPLAKKHLIEEGLLPS